MPVEADPNVTNAARRHYELYAGPMVTNARMFIISILLGMAALVQAIVLASLWESARHQRIIILQKASTGALDHVEYVNAGAYQPGQKSIEYFAYAYVVATYSRVRATLPADFTNHLAFLSEEIRNREKNEQQRNKWIEAFQQNGDPEVRVTVKKIRFGGTDHSPYRLSVDFEKRFTVNGQVDQDKTENWTTDLIYILTPEGEVSNDLIPVNPLGMTIIESRESKGF